AVVATSTANQTGFAGLAFDTPVGPHHLDDGIGTFRTGVREENMIQTVGGVLGQLVGQLKCGGVSKLKGGRVVQLPELTMYGCLDFMASVSGTTSPKPGQTVKNLAAFLIVEPVSFRLDDQARVLLEVPVRRKGHPVGLEIEFTGNLLWRKVG